MRARAVTRPVVLGAIAVGLLLGTVLVAGYVARPGNETPGCEVEAGQCPGRTPGCCGDVGPADCGARSSTGKACPLGTPKQCCEMGAGAPDNAEPSCPSGDAKPCHQEETGAAEHGCPGCCGAAK